MSLWKWLGRLFASAPPARADAAAMLSAIQDLQRANAGWPEIWERLNPRQDKRIQELLIAIRGPHMFLPHLGLSVMESGCRRALAANPHADRIAALETALVRVDPFVR